MIPFSHIRELNIDHLCTLYAATSLQKQLEAAHHQIQQLHQQPPQPPQPLPQQMPLCPLCAHRQQREEVLVHQRQRVETDLRNLLAGKTEEVQLLHEQVGNPECCCSCSGAHSGYPSRQFVFHDKMYRGRKTDRAV